MTPLLSRNRQDERAREKSCRNFCLFQRHDPFSTTVGFCQKFSLSSPCSPRLTPAITLRSLLLLPANKHELHPRIPPCRKQKSPNSLHELQKLPREEVKTYSLFTVPTHKDPENTQMSGNLLKDSNRVLNSL